jgi:hypothetical protein
MLNPLLSALDRSLRARQRIFEYSSSPTCLFRIQLVTNDDDLILTDGTRLAAGGRLVALHLWNEQIPPFPTQGPSLGWARRVNRDIKLSLTELSDFVASRSELDDVVAVSGTLALGPGAAIPLMSELAARYGFIGAREPVMPRRSVAERLHRFGENILISLIVWSHNPSALRGSTMRRARLPVYLPRAALLGRFGGQHQAKGQPDHSLMMRPEPSLGQLDGRAR